MLLTYNKDKILTGESKKRLQAIKDFTEAGIRVQDCFKRFGDPRCRNILGAEQHGFMVAVGFDLYCRLLEEAIADLKQEKRKNRPPTHDQSKGKRLYSRFLYR